MSSKRTGAAGKAAMAAEPAAGTAAAEAGFADPAAGVSGTQPGDPWFEAGPKVAAPAEADAAANGAPASDSAEARAEWFLRTGRAGLLPGSMTVSWDDDGTGDQDGGHDIRVEAAGAPPWAAEAADVPVAAPPPWETGPWPGPGGDAAGSSASSRRGLGDSVAGAADAAARDDGSGSLVAAPAVEGRWSARTVLIAGLVPLVVPGLVVGILGLRQASAPSVRKASVVAIGASLAWALIIVVIVAGGSGGSPGACTGYPAAVHHAYDKAMADLREHVPATAQAADFGSAASMANASAAAAGQIGVRTALFTMANDMAQARADVVAGRPVPATLRTHLAADSAAPAGSCTT
jgi:hypothetical protein